ncbi:PAS domain S-box protein [Piscinibacter aquaticus]|uniref:PAS domain S-box protein n=1 Tax=Piscinibacter aquaticus TaxID=392597 RepID=A0A5C6TY99_9BURK|nr:PAS domain S-box protein [Piscinibacter aquaticus]
MGAGRPARRRAQCGAPPATLADGRQAHIARRRLDSGDGALSLRLHAPVASAPPLTGPAHSVEEAFRLVWDAPFPASLQDADFRIVDVNPAYLDFTGYTREALIGRDPIELQPDEDRPRTLAARDAYLALRGEAETGPLFERRLIDAQGRERWYRAARRRVTDAQGRTLLLVIMQDSTAEHAARERADRSARELDQWFDLSPVGMVLFDERGLVVRSNPAFEALVGSVPVTLPEADEAVRELLCWQGEGVAAELRPGAPPLERQVWLPRPGAAPLRLRAVVRCYKSSGGSPRFMAIVEDRSAEEERDLAQLQIGAMMDTAGVGRPPSRNRRAGYGSARAVRPAAPPRRCRRSAATWCCPSRSPSTNGCSARCAWASAPRCAMRCATRSWASAGCSRAWSRPRWPPASAPRRSSRWTSPSRSRRARAARNCCAR